MTKLNIGNVELDNNIILAPMAGITDSPLRRLAKSGGASLVYTEMVSAKSILYNSKKTKSLLRISNDERPISVQIFGSDAYIMAEAAKTIRDMDIDIIDINLGCPANKIVKTGAGSKLLSNEKLVSKILEYVVKSVDIPVTAKIRIGILPEENVASGIVKIAQSCGVKMLTIHARSVSQRHSGIPNLKLFADACRDAKIPIIANGGIIDEKTAISFMRIPNCKGIMIGRGAIGNYSIFKGLVDFFNNGNKLSSSSKTERMIWLKKHIGYSIEHYGEKKGLIVIRKIVNYYIRNLPNAAKIREIFNKIGTLSDFNRLIKFIF
ncbi:MAG: tRNA dihydrouridine synthase DusB [Endomicrobium sp.]|jgi:tRNA-dihydrouridine synthase B|nr:tRNA dihydrouridine synthase DusB [Endomicrobium sp.]